MSEPLLQAIIRVAAIPSVLISIALLAFFAGCSSNASAGVSGREQGANEATAAIAAGKLKLKEYPPLPYPPGHGDYVQLLRDTGIEYEVAKLPAGVDQLDFVQQVQGYNEVMRAEIMRVHGPDVFTRLRKEASEAKE